MKGPYKVADGRSRFKNYKAIIDETGSEIRKLYGVFAVWAESICGAMNLAYAAGAASEKAKKRSKR